MRTSITRAHHKIILTSGLTVEMLRNIAKFMHDFADEVAVNNRIVSHLGEWKRAVHHVAEINEPKKKKKAKREIDHLSDVLSEEFLDAVEDVGDLFKELKIVSIDDATLLYREVDDIISLMEFVFSLKVSDREKLETIARLRKLYGLLTNIKEALHHFWVVSKAQERGKLQVEELVALSTSRAVMRRTKRGIIHARALTEDISVEKEDFIKLVNKARKEHVSHQELHQQIHKIIHAYEHEFHCLHEIMEHTKLLIHRTEELLETLEREAEEFEDKKVEKRLKQLKKSVHDVLVFLRKQGLRQYMDVDKIVDDAGNEGAAAIAKLHHSFEADALRKLG